MMKFRHLKLDGDDDGNIDHHSFHSHGNDDDDDDDKANQHQQNQSGRIRRAFKNMKDISTNALVIPPVSPRTLVQNVVRKSGNIIPVHRRSASNNLNGSFRSSKNFEHTPTKEEMMNQFSKMASETSITKTSKSKSSSGESSSSLATKSSTTAKTRTKKQSKEGIDVNSEHDNSKTNTTRPSISKKNRAQQPKPYVYQQDNINDSNDDDNANSGDSFSSQLQSSFATSVQSSDTKSTTTYTSPTMKKKASSPSTPASILRKTNLRYNSGSGSSSGSIPQTPGTIPQTPSRKSPRSSSKKLSSPDSKVQSTSYRMELSPVTSASVPRNKILRKGSGGTNTTTGTAGSTASLNAKHRLHYSASDLLNANDDDNDETVYHMSFTNYSAFGVMSTTTKSTSKEEEFYVVNKNDQYHNPFSSSPQYKEYEDNDDDNDGGDDDRYRQQLLPPVPSMSPEKSKRTKLASSTSMKKAHSLKQFKNSKSYDNEDVNDSHDDEYTIHTTKSENRLKTRNSLNKSSKNPNVKPRKETPPQMKSKKKLIIATRSNDPDRRRIQSETNIHVPSSVPSIPKKKMSATMAKSSKSVCSSGSKKSKSKAKTVNDDDGANDYNDDNGIRKVKSTNNALSLEEQELLLTSLAAAMIGIDVTSMSTSTTPTPPDRTTTTSTRTKVRPSTPSSSSQIKKSYQKPRVEKNIAADEYDDHDIDAFQGDDACDNNEDIDDYDNIDDEQDQLEQYYDDDNEEEDYIFNNNSFAYKDRQVEYDDDDDQDYVDDDNVNDDNDEEYDDGDGGDEKYGEAEHSEDEVEQGDEAYDDEYDDEQEEDEHEDEDETQFDDDNDEEFDKHLGEDFLPNEYDYENLPDHEDDVSNDDGRNDEFVEDDCVPKTDQNKYHGHNDEKEKRRNSTVSSTDSRRRSSRKSSKTANDEQRRGSNDVPILAPVAVEAPEPTRLYVYAQQCKWSKVSKECKIRGSDARFVSEIDGGYTALHLAVISRCNPHTFYYDNESNCIDDVQPAPLSVMEELIIACPEAAIIRCTKKRYTPLSYACSTPAAGYRFDMRDTATLVKIILKHAPHSAMVFTDEELSPLDIHIVSYSERIRQQEQKVNPGKKDEANDLTKRTKRDTSTAVVSVLLEANPTLAEARSHKESIVGPIELLYRCNLGKFKQMSREDEFDFKKGKYSSASKKRHVELEKVDDWWAWKWTLMLLQYSFKAGSIYKDDELTFVPLHAAASLTACPIAILLLALNLDPKEIEERNPKDDLYNLPLHDVCSWITNDNIISGDPFVVRRKERAIMLLLHAFPKAARMTNNVGETPLILAIESCTPWEKGLKVILRQCPNALLFPRKLPSQGHVNRALSSAIKLMHYGENESLCSEDTDYWDDPLETVEGMYPFMLGAVLSHIPECRRSVPPTILFHASTSFDDVLSPAGADHEKRKKNHQAAINSKDLESLRTIFGLLRAKPEALQKFRDEERRLCIEELTRHYQKQQQEQQKGK